jgi:hypothetical protein
MTSAYHEGFNAFIKGLTTLDNPYKAQTTQSKDWNVGYLDSRAVDLLKWRV